MSDIIVDHVTFQYVRGTGNALCDLHLTVPEGQMVLLAGPSGCGKSTLGYAVAGLIPERISGRMRGAVYHGSRRLTGMPLHEVAQQVGIVFQNPESQLLQYDVASEVAFGPENLNLPANQIRERVQRSMSMTGVDHLQTQSLITLSGGQKQRVAIAAALAMEPSVLVLDEPTADLDPLGTQEVLQVIRRLNAVHRMTVILIEHKIDEVIGYSDRVILMDEGRILVDAPPRTALRDTGPWDRASVTVPQIVRLSHALPEIFHQEIALTVSEAVEPLRSVVEKRGFTHLPSLPSWIRNTPPLLQWDNVHLSYREHRVLRNASLAVHPAEWVALVGANGSGKSSLAGLAMGFSSPTEGRVLFKGLPVVPGNIGLQARMMGYLFQSPDTMLFSETVKKELVFGFEFGSTERRKKALALEDLIKLADLEQYADKNPFQLSYGQRQRLAIAALLATRPEILILDEPTTGQDEGHSFRLLQFLQQLQKEFGLALLMISHDMRTVARYAHSMAILGREGQIVLEGRPAHVFSQTERLREANLNAPPLAELHTRLIDEPLSRVALTEEELLYALRLAPSAHLRRAARDEFP